MRPNVQVEQQCLVSTMQEFLTRLAEANFDKRKKASTFRDNLKSLFGML